MGRSITLAATVAVVLAAAGPAIALARTARVVHRERAAGDAADTSGPLDIASVAVAQDGDTLAFAPHPGALYAAGARRWAPSRGGRCASY